MTAVGTWHSKGSRRQEGGKERRWFTFNDRRRERIAEGNYLKGRRGEMKEEKSPNLEIFRSRPITDRKSVGE